MKKCPRCNRSLPFESFSIESRRKDGRQTACKECRRKADNLTYASSSDRRAAIRKSSNEQRQARRKWLDDYKREHGCADCGETDPLVLDFDHLSGKVDNVSSMAMRGLLWETILEEVAKCEVVCANDHRRRTHARR